jgi:hypothetical protein
MSLSIDIVQNAWRLAATKYANNNGAFNLGTPSQFLPFLISDRNRAAAGFSTSEFTRNDKGNTVVKIKQLKRAVPNQPSPNTDNGFCGIGGDTISYITNTYELNRKTVASITIDQNIVTCSEESRQQAVADSYKVLINNATTKLAIEVEQEAFAKIGGTNQYRHIGRLPTLDGTPRYAGEALPLFRASDNRINYTGNEKLDRDRMLGGLMDYVLLGNTLGRSYARMQSISGLADDGFNYGMLDQIQQARFLFSDNISTNTQIQQPLLALEAGAFQFVPFAEFAISPEINVGYGITKTSIIDPVFGLTWNLIEQMLPCEGRRLKTNIILELEWTLISAPVCAINDPRRDGTNGAYLYTIACSDDTICTLEEAKSVFNYNAAILPQCAPNADPICNDGCNVALSGYISNDGDDYIVTANPIVSQGAAVVSYAWLVDGAPYVGNTQSISIDNSTLFGGEVIQITVTDSLGCVAVNTLVVDKQCPIVGYSLKVGAAAANSVVNGDTVSLGTITASTVLKLIITNDVGANTAINLVALTASGNGVASLTIPTLPLSIAAAGSANIDVVAKNTTGTYQIVYTVTSNDCNDPVFTVTVNYSIA